MDAGKRYKHAFKLETLLTLSITDIDELNLNFNQIIRLSASFGHKNLVKAVNFALDTTERSKS